MTAATERGAGVAPRPGQDLVPHTVPALVFRALARARGGATAVDLLRNGQLSKRMLMVRALRRAADGHPEEGTAEAAYRALVELNRRDRAAWHEVMLHPYLDEGLTRALTALDRGLPTDLRWLEHLTADPGRRAWHRVDALCDGTALELRLADHGPFREAHGHELAEPLTAGQTQEWTQALRAAWTVLVTRHPWHAQTIAAGLTTVVPLRPKHDGTEVSSAARRAFGAVAVSLPDDPVLLALTLVHEFLHVQLGALLDLLPLHGPPTDARYHAPWRPDPRPAGALLQGTYAHLGVTDFWRAEVASGTGGERARREYDTWREHTDTAVGTLLESGELLPAGERFVTELREAVRRRSVPAGTLRGRADLVHDLRELGLRAGDTVLVHSALSTVGPVSNGAETMVSALSEVLGPDGTLVMYTPTPDDARAATPAPAPYTAAGLGVGVLAETVRTRPAALRSAHPRSAFTALGAQADHITSDHSPDCSLGEESPLGRLEKLDARVLLLGTGFEACTAFHLAEYRVPSRLAGLPEGADPHLDTSPFAALGAAFEATGAVRSGRVGHAHCRLFDFADAVAFAVGRLADRAPGE
ncbi:AAC(3) family N-acetyltransferase [Streptomyces sp. DSM 3412]|uniref:AAC(3) family N-acetyltransferase n=1 Tax=Streptomyces gottesmaniae TaxID=3075518 RepID=A0ABU2YQ76_9ACTN|nr:AAC(3) family N-acetyltransferase [Streptomyces sp. DSM 3412]MDT0566473.1 AAC(3) family N-acetyltransferase [Streptomyces sp. DSM 3412]